MSTYFSNQVCAGGCGNLLPQKIVDRGRQYLYGHKTGCPAEGETTKRRVAVVRAPPRKEMQPRVIEHTSYARTLAMTLENADLAIAEMRAASVALEDAMVRCSSADTRCGNLRGLIESLLRFVAKEAP